MARIQGLEARQAGWFARLAYAFTRRKLGRVVRPIKIMAHHPRLLWALAEMEQGQQAAKSLDAALKSLAEVKVPTLIGCPF